jgi:peptidoglycan hydrolase-like protein with peptidoglycan-binding domain
MRQSFFNLHLAYAFTVVFVAICLPTASAEPSKAKKDNTSANAHRLDGGKRDGKASRQARRTASRSRRATPPRQAAPTAERYMEVQRALSDRGYYSGEVDGEWDGECVSALKRFQEEQNLTPDGKLGALSLINLGLGPKREPLNELVGKPATTPE